MSWKLIAFWLNPLDDSVSGTFIVYTPTFVSWVWPVLSQLPASRLSWQRPKLTPAMAERGNRRNHSVDCSWSPSGQSFLVHHQELRPSDGSEGC
jgi:hypothetical protein